MRTTFSARKRRYCRRVEGTHGRDEVLLLVNIRDVRFLHLLADDLVGVNDVTKVRACPGCNQSRGLAIGTEQIAVYRFSRVDPQES
jgi:hypothetical protein